MRKIAVLIFSIIILSALIVSAKEAQREIKIDDVVFGVEISEGESFERMFTGIFSVDKFRGTEVQFCESEDGNFLSAAVKPNTKVFINGKNVSGDTKKKLSILSRLNNKEAVMYGVYQPRSIEIDGYRFYRDYWKEVHIVLL